MANYFDQFDAAPDDGHWHNTPQENANLNSFEAAPSPAPTTQANYFDKFDAPAAPVANDNPFDATAPAAPTPDKPEDSWLQTGLDTLKQIPGSFEKAAGGMLQAVGNSDMELPAGVGVGANDPEADAMASFNTQGKAGLQSPAKIGASISQAAQQSIVANAPNVPDGSAKYYANTLGIGIGQMLPALMGSLLTHSAAPIIAQTAATSFGNSYANAIAQNPNDPDAAAAKATGLATIDTAAAAIGIKAFGIQPFASVIGKITNEATGEFASVTQQSISDMIKNVMLQGVAIQPAIAVVNRSVDNWVNGKPITEGLGDEYVTGALQNTLIMGIGHMASQPKPTLGKVQAGEPGPGSGPGPIIDGDFTPKGPGPAPAGTPQIAAPIDPQFVQPGDAKSPIPTSIIAAGRQSASEAGTPIAQDPVSNDVLVRNGWPKAGTPVNLDDGVNPPLAGTIHSAAPDQAPGGTNDALNVQLDSGHMLQTFRQEIEQAGVTITPQQAQQAGLPLDIATNSAGTSQEQPQPQPVAATSAPAGTVGPENAAAAQTPPQPVSQGMPVDLFQPNNPQVVIPQDSNNPAVVTPPAAAVPPTPAEPISPPAAAAPPTTGDGTAAAPIEVTHPDHVEQVAPLVNTAPTPAQADAGNYQKAHLKIQGLPITIENPKGSVRSGVGADGQPWSVTQPAAYGYIKRSTGADGEQVDAYVGPNPQSSKVFVIDQKDAQTGAYDEAKSFVGFDNKQQALDTYHAAFSDGLGPQRMGGIREMNTVQFKKLLNSGALDKPVGGEFKPGPAAKEIITSTNQTGPSDQNSTPEEITPKAILKTPRAPLAPSTETSVLENIRRLGGIRTQDANGQRTKEGQDVHAVLQDVKRPGLINNKNGQRPDTIREDMAQQGWFGRHEGAGSDIQKLYDLMDKEVRNGPQYHPESERGAAIANARDAADSERVKDDAIQAINAASREYREIFSEADKATMLKMVEGGLDPESAVAEYVERRAVRGTDDAADDASHGYEDVPFEGGLAGTGNEAGARGQEPETEPGKEGGSGIERAPPEEVQAPAGQGDGQERVGEPAEVNPPPLAHGDGSWIIVDRATGKAVTEMFKDSKAIHNLNTEKYEAIPAGKYLASLNKRPATDLLGDVVKPAQPTKYTPEELNSAVDAYRALRGHGTVLDKAASDAHAAVEAARTGTPGAHAVAVADRKDAQQASSDYFDKIEAMARKWGAKGVDLDSEIAKPVSDAPKFSPSRTQTDTPEFKNWFGDSKVVDETGAPMVVYHGAEGGADFDTFDVPAYFSSNEETAGTYGETKKAYLSFQNPLIVNAKGRTYKSFVPFHYIEEAKSGGHDGLIVKNIRDDARMSGAVANTYIAFTQGQIKSADGNSGAFDRANPDTRFSPSGEPRMFDTEAGSAVDGHGNVVPQTVIPGAKGDAVQLAKAREAAGKGKSTTGVAQKSAGGMFGEEPKEPEQGALFRPGDGEASAPTTDDVDHLYTPKFDEVRQHVADTLRAELDRMGLHDIALTLPDALSANGQGMEGVFADRAIHVALSGPDPASTFNHEAIHAFKALGLFTKSEWSILDAKATKDWRRDFDVDNRWKGLGFTDADFNEEAIAEAYRNWRSQQGLQPTGLVARIFNKLRDALAAIKAAFTGRGFKSPDDIFGSRARDIFGKVADGKVGRRPRGEASETAAKFSPAEDAEPRSEADKALDAYIGARAREMGWAGEPTSEAMYRKAMFTPKGPLKTELSRNAGLIKKLEEQRSAPFQSRLTANKGDGETKVRGTSQSIADKAAKSGMVIDDLQNYDVATRKPIMERSRKFVNDDATYEQAKAVAMGEEPAPHGTTPNSILIAVEERAAREKDVELTRHLAAHSSVLANNTEMAREIGMNAERDPLSAAAVLKKIKNAREGAAKATGTPSPKAKKNAVNDMLREANKRPDASAGAKKLKLQSFIDAVMCKE